MVVAAAAAGHAAAMSGESAEVDAAMDAAGTADFSRHSAVARVLADPAAQRAFNRAVGAAVGRFASGEEGWRAVVAGDRPSRRVGSACVAACR